MKKLIISCGLIALSMPVLAAESINCSSLPSCSSLGYTDSSTSCSEYIPCPFDKTKVKCIPQAPKAGDILYSDGTTSSTKLSSKTAVGVVVDPGRRYAISLKEAKKQFGKGTKPTDMELMPDNNLRGSNGTNADGRLNSKALSSSAYPAAKYCREYSTAGYGAGKWWLPSPHELSRIYPYFDAVETGLSRAGGTAFTFTNTVDQYWTSSVGEDATLGCWAAPSDVWIRCDITKQTTSLPTRCFVQF